MLGEIDPLDYLLAEATGRALSEVRSWPNSEVVEWRAFYRYRAAHEKLNQA